MDAGLLADGEVFPRVRVAGPEQDDGRAGGLTLLGRVDDEARVVQGGG
jgi:hypothetical protein